MRKSPVRQNVLVAVRLGLTATACLLLTACGTSDSRPSWNLLGTDNSRDRSTTIAHQDAGYTHTHPLPRQRYTYAPVDQQPLYPAAPPPNATPNHNYNYGHNSNTHYDYSRNATPRYDSNRTSNLTTSSLQDSVVVQQGDTLFAISRRTGVPVGQLIARNKLASEKIYPGQRLELR